MPKYFDGFGLVIGGLVSLIAGIALLVLKSDLVTLITTIVGFMLIVNGLLYSLSFFTSKNSELLPALLTLIFGLVLLVFPNVSLVTLSIIFSLYLLTYAIVKGISFYIFYRNKVKGRYHVLFSMVLLLIFSLSTFFAPYVRRDFAIRTIAWYLCMMGISFIFEGCSILLPVRRKNSLKRKFRVNLPAILSAFVPIHVLEMINEHFALEDENDIEDKNELLLIEEKKNDRQVNLEVFVHVTKKGFGTIGHCDLCFDGEVISFGNYDQASYRLFEMIGDGVLFTTVKEDYIPFCIHHSRKTIFAYGLSLNQKQYDRVAQAIAKLKENVYPWMSPYQRTLAQRKEFKDIYIDYASMLYKSTRASFYKFKSGKFKTYFVMNTNCVLLVDQVIGKAGIDLIDITGIITPGAYQTYFDKEFMKKNSFVVTRRVYGTEEHE